MRYSTMSQNEFIHEIFSAEIRRMSHSKLKIIKLEGMSQPLITIITNTKNRADLISRCIESIQHQSYQNYEHIIADGCSTDNTESVVLSYNDPRIKYIKVEGGPVAQMREAFALSQGEYITFLDDDDEYRPEKLQKQLDLILTLPAEYGFIYGTMSYYDNDTKRYLYDHKAEYNGGEELLATAISDAIICGTPSLMYRREAFASIGGSWIANIGNEASDWALACITLKHGWKVAPLRESYINVYVNHGSTRMSNESFYTDRCERYIKFHKYFLEEYAETIWKHPRSAIKHYEGLVFYYTMLGQFGLAWQFNKKLLKVRFNFRSLALLPYYMYKRLMRR